MKKGFILLEILIGLTFLGIVAAASLPVIINSNRNMERAVERTSMLYLCDYIAQKLKTDGDEVAELLKELLEKDTVQYNGNEIDEGSYDCYLYLKHFEGDYLLFDVILESNKYDDMEVRLEVSRQIRGILTD